MQNYVLTDAKICTAEKVIEGAIAVENGSISAIGDIAKSYQYLPHFHCQSGDMIMPGFIDMHIHGSKGCDVMDADIDSLETITSSLYAQGVTSFLATTMTQSDQAISNALKTVAQFQKQSQSNKNMANILGVHLEGPFISPGKIGAQNPRHLQLCSLEKLNRWQHLSGNNIKKITIAPEITGADQIIHYSVEKGIIASIGHTACSAKIAYQAIAKGCTQATHLFNAMSGMDHRNPGAATALLMSKKIVAELIVDGVHLANETVRMVYEIKGADHIILITDAISAQAYGQGVFSLGGQKVIVRNNEARLENGILAGSVLMMNQALQNMRFYTGCSMPALVKMTSLNAAKSLFQFKKGDIAVGMDADLVRLDQHFQVQQVYNS